MTRIPTLLSLFVLAFNPHVASGAEPGQPPARTFRIFSVVGHCSDLKFDQKQNRDPIKLSIYSNPSKTYAMPQGGELVLYREIPAPPDSPPGTPAIIKDPAVIIPIPPGLNRALIAIAPLAKGKYAAQVIGDDQDQHPADTIKVINLSSSSAAIALNETNRQIEAGRSTLMSLPKGDVMIQLAVLKGDKWSIALKSGERFSPGSRFNMFVFNYTPDPDSFTTQPLAAIVRIFEEQLPKANPAPGLARLSSP